jgi:hypothetical protein
MSHNLAKKMNELLSNFESKPCLSSPEDPSLSPQHLLQPENAHLSTTNHKTTFRRVGDLLIDLQGTFFQNNDSALVPKPLFVRDAVLPHFSPSGNPPTSTAITNLLTDTTLALDFSLTLALHFTKVSGIEVSASPICFSTHNFRKKILLPLLKRRSDLRCSALVSPHQGCDEAFVQDLLAFRA